MKKLVLYKDLMWNSDWNGDEVGYPEILIIGLYLLKDTEIHFYIDMETLQIIEAWIYDEEEECDTPIDFSIYTITY